MYDPNDYPPPPPPLRLQRPTVPLLPAFVMAAACLGATPPPQPRKRDPEDPATVTEGWGTNSPPTLRLPTEAEKRLVESRAAAVGGFAGTLDLLAPRGFAPGPCEVCGKPNVRAGRERGIYRCGEHLEP